MLRKTLLYNTLLNKIIQVPDKIVIRWGMIFPVLILMCISFITLKYTSVNSSFFSSTFTKQIVWFGMGSIILFWHSGYEFNIFKNMPITSMVF